MSIPATAQNPTIITDGTPGSWYIDSCPSTFGVAGLTVFIPAGGAPAPAAPAPPSPAQLAQEALGEIQLTAPGLQLSPASQANADVDQIVGAPTWAWIPAAEWVPLTATAAAGPVVVTATATPETIDLTYTDGGQTQSASCHGPGMPYSDVLASQEDPDAPLSAASPDCGWTYKDTSAGAADELEPITGAVTYDVTWTVTGAAGGGDLGPLTSPATTYQVRVEEIQVVNTD